MTLVAGFPTYTVVLVDEDLRSSPSALAAWLCKMYEDGYELIACLGELCIFKWRTL